MEKYLDAVVAYISTDDYERTKQHVEMFLHNTDDVDKINKFLQQRNEENKNWVLASEYFEIYFILLKINIKFIRPSFVHVNIKI